MRFPNPAVRLPQWGWLNRFDRWRLERGILTGRWTQAEVDNIKQRAHQRWLALPQEDT
jgi:hypothetical protein